MNQFEVPRDEEEVKRIFRESDTLGADSALMLRALRHFFKDGKPIGQMVLLSVPVNGQGQHVFGMLTLTDNGRLVFWPALPRKAKTACRGRKTLDAPDHITIELPEETVHVTGYTASGKPVRAPSGKRRWRTVPMGDSGFRLAAGCLIRSNVIQEQDVLLSRMAQVPNTDMNRRTTALTSFAACLTHHHVGVRADDCEKHFLYCGLFLSSRTADANKITSLPMLGKEIMSGWGEGTQYEIGITGLSLADSLGDVALWVVVSFPPGQMVNETEIIIPSPQSRPR